MKIPKEIEEMISKEFCLDFISMKKCVKILKEFAKYKENFTISKDEVKKDEH